MSCAFFRACLPYVFGYIVGIVRMRARMCILLILSRHPRLGIHTKIGRGGLGWAAKARWDRDDPSTIRRGLGRPRLIYWYPYHII